MVLFMVFPNMVRINAKQIIPLEGSLTIEWE
jgi:hypothetical protein